MGTRSFIAMYDEDTAKYHAVYCHWDGYPEGVGLTLRFNYDTPMKVRELVSLGDFSSLRDTIEETQAESYKVRGDTDVDTLVFSTSSEMESYYRGCWCEYGYMYLKGKWICVSLTTPTINLYDINKETEHAQV